MWQLELAAHQLEPVTDGVSTGTGAANLFDGDLQVIQVEHLFIG
jgi:hypothetical protein